MKSHKKSLLLKGLLYDAIGMASYAIPLFGSVLDLVWAPIAAGKMRKMYPGKKGIIASGLVFLEEVLPGTDIIPSFTLMWLYTFVWKAEKEQSHIVIEAA